MTDRDESCLEAEDNDRVSLNDEDWELINTIESTPGETIRKNLEKAGINYPGVLDWVRDQIVRVRWTQRRSLFWHLRGMLNRRSRLALFAIVFGGLAIVVGLGLVAASLGDSAPENRLAKSTDEDLAAAAESHSGKGSLISTDESGPQFNQEEVNQEEARHARAAMPFVMVCFYRGEGVSELNRKRIVEFGYSNKNAIFIVEGHTCDTPVLNKERDNWDVSYNRAKAVAKILMEIDVPPRDIEIRPYSDTRPLTDEDIDIILEDDQDSEIQDLEFIRMLHRRVKIIAVARSSAHGIEDDLRIDPLIHDPDSPSKRWRSPHDIMALK